MLKIKDNVYIRHNIFLGNTIFNKYICYLNIPVSHYYAIIPSDNQPECAIRIDKRTNTLSELKLTDSSALSVKLYFSSNNNIYSANINSSHISSILSLYFYSPDIPTLWQQNASNYYIIIDSLGYVSRIQRISDGVEVSFNEDGSISELSY